MSTDNGFRTSARPIRLEDLISRIFTGYAGNIGLPREDWAGEDEWLDGVIDDVLDAIPVRNVEDVFRQALRMVVVEVLDREHRAAESLERERMLHATGQAHKSAWPEGAFPGLPDE